ncbi:MAG TPA: hypothetical protein VG435_13380 [Acidimicrobiales bacterium]|jgi:hypothetical protein|nr:hypothetical protein [Acidimicrobiales bacterium]
MSAEQQQIETAILEHFHSPEMLDRHFLIPAPPVVAPYERVSVGWRAQIVRYAHRFRLGHMYVEWRFVEVDGESNTSQAEKFRRLAPSRQPGEMSWEEKGLQVRAEFEEKVAAGEYGPGDYLSGRARVIAAPLNENDEQLFMPRPSPSHVHVGSPWALPNAGSNMPDLPGVPPTPTKYDYIRIREAWSGDLDRYLEGVRVPGVASTVRRPVVYLTHVDGVCPYGCTHLKEEDL